MTVSPTYPGVYVEEIPSGVHTITGVSTAITAFIGYTAQGDVDTPVHIFSFADFQRAFGGLSVDSPLSYCVRDFFQNGGGEAYVVRVAKGAAAASVEIEDAAGTPVLTVTAASAGTWGNNLQIDVDYDTLDPANLFNLRVANYVDQGGKMALAASETFRNLSMNPFDPGYVASKINATSQLISVAVLPFAVSGNGSSSTGAGTFGAPTVNNNRLAFILDGQELREITLSTASTTIHDVAVDIVAKINALLGPNRVSETDDANGFTILSGDTTLRSSIRFFNASATNAAALLRLGSANGGHESDLEAKYRPVQTGTVGGAALAIPFPSGSKPGGTFKLNIYVGGSGTPAKTVVLVPWPNQGSAPTTSDAALAAIRAALAASTEPVLAGATASVIGGVLRIAPGDGDPRLSFGFVDSTVGTDDTATLLKLSTLATAVRNVGRYAPGATFDLGAQLHVASGGGNNGIAPTNLEFLGNELNKTGLYALANVDLFNLLVIPEATLGSGMADVLATAIAYCERRRAFMILDTPETVSTFAQAQTWIDSAPASALRSRNSALYFPRLREPDPLMGGVVGTFASAGAIAGLYARTDADRGVWKAPAGTAATIAGAVGLSYTLTDGENGTLNPKGLNCLRTFPVYGTVSWGARTGKGADALTDDYKYIPVRRLALFLEESLYRGTQWAVFEPNDEPLWASIRLNLGAFMHLLFAQGAFQGRTPRDAYFVRCDKDTTTQNDIDLGRVNILVGFAPLKPAEFVIIQIQQMAGQIVT